MRQGIESSQGSPKVINGGLGQNRTSPQPCTLISKRNGEGPNEPKAHSDQDLEFDCDPETRPLIPGGKYEVGF